MASQDAAEIAEGAAPIGHGKLQWRILIGFVLGLAAGPRPPAAPPTRVSSRSYAR